MAAKKFVTFYGFRCSENTFLRILYRPFHTSKFNRIQCASNANWARSHCTSSNAHRMNAHRVNPPRDVDWKRIEPNRVGVPEVMNNE